VWWWDGEVRYAGGQAGDLGLDPGEQDGVFDGADGGLTEVAGDVDVVVPDAGQEVTKDTFHFHLRVDAFKAAQARDGSYLLRASAAGTIRPNSGSSTCC